MSEKNFIDKIIQKVKLNLFQIIEHKEPKKEKFIINNNYKILLKASCFLEKNLTNLSNLAICKLFLSNELEQSFFQSIKIIAHELILDFNKFSENIEINELVILDQKSNYLGFTGKTLLDFTEYQIQNELEICAINNTSLLATLLQKPINLFEFNFKIEKCLSYNAIKSENIFNYELIFLLEMQNK